MRAHGVAAMNGATETIRRAPCTPPHRAADSSRRQSPLRAIRRRVQSRSWLSSRSGVCSSKRHGSAIRQSASVAEGSAATEEPQLPLLRRTPGRGRAGRGPALPREDRGQQLEEVVHRTASKRPSVRNSASRYATSSIRKSTPAELWAGGSARTPGHGRSHPPQLVSPHFCRFSQGLRISIRLPCSSRSRSATALSRSSSRAAHTDEERTSIGAYSPRSRPAILSRRRARPARVVEEVLVEVRRISMRQMSSRCVSRRSLRKKLMPTS